MYVKLCEFVQSATVQNTELLRYTVDNKIILALAIILVIFSVLTVNFYHRMLVINSINTNVHELTNIYFTKLH